jgi:molybdenum cofactor synthesis domain-containing protein
MEMRAFGALTPYPIALQRLLRATRPLRESEDIGLASAIGRVPSRDVRARSAVPPFVRATWDGYALRSAETRGARTASPRTFRIVGEVFADTAFGRPLAPGETVAIATGGALPRGADCVIIFEEATARPPWLTVRRPVRAGERIARPGEDFPKGARLVRAGVPLTPAAIGALAAAGSSSVRVWRRPSVAIVPNGNELVAPGGRLGEGQIFESNNLVLAGLLRSQGIEPALHAAVADHIGVIERTLWTALQRHDAVLVTGGSSVGDHDYLPKVFPRLGRMLFHGLAVRPGKPTLAAVSKEGKLLIGLPGHPTSCLANGFWLLLPFLRRLAHLPGSGTYPYRATMAEEYPIEEGPLATVVPLRVAAGRAWPTFKGSSAVTSLAEANGFVIVPPKGRSLARGTELTVQMLPPPLGALPSALGPPAEPR